MNKKEANKQVLKLRLDLEIEKVHSDSMKSELMEKHHEIQILRECLSQFKVAAQAVDGQLESLQKHLPFGGNLAKAHKRTRWALGKYIAVELGLTDEGAQERILAMVQAQRQGPITASAVSAAAMEKSSETLPVAMPFVELRGGPLHRQAHASWQGTRLDIPGHYDGYYLRHTAQSDIAFWRPSSSNDVGRYPDHDDA